MASNVYAKGCLMDSDKDWYHGELTRNQAEEALRASGSNCFLIRESEGNLILSLIHHGDIYHTVIKHGPGWYSLSSEERFSDLNELVSYYHNNPIITESGEALTAHRKADHNSDHSVTTTTGVYCKGIPADLTKYHWYYGEITEEETMSVLYKQTVILKHNCFLVRQSDNLILSAKIKVWIKHFTINRSPEGYCLQGRNTIFKTIPEMITHYQTFPIDGTQKLGTACDRLTPNLARNELKCVEKEIALTLGAACRKADHNSDHNVATTTGVYCKGFPENLTRYHWYYGEITEEESLSVLYQQTKGRNSFLVRQSANELILSARLQGWIKHFTINRSPEGYCLQGRNTIFKTTPEMITHYQMFPVDGTQSLGTACDRLIPNLARNESESEKSFKKEVHDQFQVIWRKCADLPVARSAPSVVRIGDSVYVGGGYTKTGDSNAIMKYSLNQDAWMPLPPCPTHQHGLATLNEELIVIGGVKCSDSLHIGTSNVYTFRNDDWMEVLPSMPTPRSLLSTATHEDRLIIAAGGVKEVKSNGEYVLTDAVEIYIKDKQWYATKRLPFPKYSFSINIVGDKCYTLGGHATTYEQSCTTLYTTLSSLLKNAEQADSSYSIPQVPVTWEKLEDQHPLVLSAITDVDSKIIALGGAVMNNALKCGTKIISTYDFQSNSWVECKSAELPLAIYKTGVVKLADDEVIVVGGGYKNQTFSAKVYIGKFQT